MAAAPTRTPYPPAAAFDVEMGVIHPNAVPDSRVESRAERAHRADAAIASLVDANPERLEDETFKIMSATEALVNAFTRLKPGIVRESDSSCMAKHIVVGGEIGLGRNINGETQIWPEGSYFWAGFGCTIDAIVKVRSDAAINSRTYKDICWFEVTHEQVAVIQKGSKTHVLGPGRYVLREPAKLMGIVNIKHLDKTESAVGYTEELMERKDAANRTVLDIQLKPVTMPSGRTAEAGGCVFVRSEAGFKAVAQAVDGTYRTFDGLELLRNGEKLIGFVDCQDYSRTTKTFQFLSNDNHTVDTRVKLDWRITKPTLWMQCKGAFSDPFDALEDKVQSGVRDEIGKKTYDELIKQKDEGFDGFEKALGPGLIAFAESKGFLLIDVQIREIKAPFIEIRNAELARKQAEANENQLEAKRAIDQQRLIDEKAKNAKIAELDREKTAAEQKASIDAVEHSRELARVKAQEARATQQVRDAAEREKIKLEAELQQAQIEASRVKTVAEGQAAAVEAEAKGRAAARIVAARAEADSLKLVAEAEAEGSKARGTAEAQRIQQVAEALRNNPAVLQLELARLNVDISNGASKAYGTGFATLTPNERQELIRMANGYNPLVSPIVVGGVVGAQSTAAAAANGRT